jgi:anaerobic magnesium-protoporphyrin IX monomethyl ester cyclase
MRVLFITPPFHAGVVEVAGRWVPLYFVTLAGSVRGAGHEAFIYDAMTKFVGYPEIEARIRELRPDVVCTTAMTCTSPDAIRLMELAKEIDPSVITIAGGVHSSFMYGEMFALTPALDYVVVGEGEVTLVELLGTLANGKGVSSVQGVAFREGDGAAFTGPRDYIEGLDALPLAWDLLDWEDYTYFILPGSRLAAIDTSRGCDKDCTFCSQQKFWKQTWRARSPEGLVRELGVLADEHKVDVVLFTDDYPTPDRERWEKFLDLMIAGGPEMYILMETRAKDIIRDKDILHKYRKAGIIHIYVGTEATDDKAMEYMKKDLSIEEAKEALALCREHGIITETSMILGFPDDTPESISKTIEQVRGFNPDFAHFLALAPWPYADMYKEMEPYIATKDYTRYNLVDPVIKPKGMTLEEVDRMIIDGYRDFYMGKFMEMMTERDAFRRDYLMKAMKRMMGHSFIKKKLGMMGEMPEEIKKILASDMGD